MRIHFLFFVFIPLKTKQNIAAIKYTILSAPVIAGSELTFVVMKGGIYTHGWMMLVVKWV